MNERGLNGANAVVGLNAVIVAVTDESPRILTVRSGSDDAASDAAALPFGPLDPRGHTTLERGLRAWVRDQSALELGYVEQLYTFGDRDRGSRGAEETLRGVSVAYLALVREAMPGERAGWRAIYDFFPWEDWRGGRPLVLDRDIQPELAGWARRATTNEGRRARRERAEIVFGLAGAPWDPERALERYELLYEAGVVHESTRDRGERPGKVELGVPLAADHRRILATALSRLRGKLRYRPVVFELLSPTFTLLQLQRVVEALAGVRLHKQNFRRLVEKTGLVEGTGQIDSATGGRPAELFRFRREVLRERSAPGVGLPGARF